MLIFMLCLLANFVTIPITLMQVLSLNEDTEEHKRFVCVNPGRLAKGIGGGTFVELYSNENTEKTNAFIMRM
jgi:DNA polymerase alpha subunit B